MAATAGRGERLPSTEDFLTPMHKGLRAMIYDLAGRLQVTDFTDPLGTERVVGDLRHELGGRVPTACIVCLLHAHTGHEDVWLFPALEPRETGPVGRLRRDHAEIEARVRSVARRGEELTRLTSAEERRRTGRTLLHEANDLFATYLDHLNREEAVLVPLMNERLTDAQIVALRISLERALAPERRAELYRWMLRSLDANELAEWFRDLRLAAPPEMLATMVRWAGSEVEPARWAVARARAGL